MMLMHAYTRFDPERAGKLLDEMGIAKRDF